ncbi:virion associated protein [Banana streak UI virus]|uniref:Virion associated protein n=1 Tax=Banana streak UI virus TaxID=1016855 RepID=F5AY20_9VIRU|nr:virion associated protein [Banana streak UI virus]AEC49878.1 virion associated protein [Banana streak UI virus]
MSVSNTEYTEALKKTKTLFGDQSTGFVTENPSQTTTAKQLNTIIQLLIQVHTKLGVLEDQLSKVKAKVDSPPSSSGKDYLADLEDITKKLSELKVKKAEPSKGTLKILKKF